MHKHTHIEYIEYMESTLCLHSFKRVWGTKVFKLLLENWVDVDVWVSGRFQIDGANEIYKIVNEAIEKVSMCLGNGTNDGTADNKMEEAWEKREIM